MNWDDALYDFMQSDLMKSVKQRVKKDREKYNVYPDKKRVLRALKLCPLDKVRVVIFGQDPYNTPGTANGLAFSSDQDKTPPSLKIIFNEIYNDLNIHGSLGLTKDEYFQSNDLSNWSKAGFLLLNTTLTVIEKQPNSHANIGWLEFTKEIVNILNKHAKRRIIFLLWGKNAQQFIPLIEQGNKHMYLTAPHPAAELYGGSAKFTGCGHFSLVRDITCSMMSTRNPDSEIEQKDLSEVLSKGYPKEVENQVMSYVNKDWIFTGSYNQEKFHQNAKRFEKLLATK